MKYGGSWERHSCNYCIAFTHCSSCILLMWLSGAESIKWYRPLVRWTRTCIWNISSPAFYMMPITGRIKAAQISHYNVCRAHAQTCSTSHNAEKIQFPLHANDTHYKQSFLLTLEFKFQTHLACCNDTVIQSVNKHNICW